MKQIQASTRLEKPGRMPWERGYVPKGYWQSKANVVGAVGYLTNKIRKAPKALTQKDFMDNRLGGLLVIHNSSPYNLLSYAGALPEGFMPWQMENGTPKGYWNSKENRAAAVKWLLERIGKGPREIGQADFEENGLLTVMKRNKCSPYLTLVEAGVLPEGFKPWQMNTAPLGFWESQENRTEAVKWLLEMTGKKPENILQLDFVSNGLRGLIKHHNSSTYLTLKNAGVLPDGFRKWNMKGGVGNEFWRSSKKNRIEAVMWLLEKTSKRPEEITRGDFKDNGLYGLVQYYKGTSFTSALKEAGVFDESLMSWRLGSVGRTPDGHYNSKENRIEAVKWLLKKTGKKPEEIGQRDFKENNLSGLLSKYNTSPYALLLNTGMLPEGFKPWQMKVSPTGLWNSKENRIAAVKWLLEKAGKRPEELNQKDFGRYGLWGLLSHYNGSPRLALKEAGVLPEGFMPWQMKDGAPNGYWNSKENRVEAVKWLVKETGKRPENLVYDDFESNSIVGCLKVYKYAFYPLLMETGLVPADFKPWQLKWRISKRYWKVRENRIAAVKWLQERIGKKPEEITRDDFKNNGLYCLLRFHHGSKFQVFNDVGVLPDGLKPWQLEGREYKGRWDSKEERIKAIRLLIEKTGKRPEEISAKDFVNNGLGGLLNKYKNSPYLALKDTGVLPEGFKPWQMKGGTLHGYWYLKENRIEAIKWLFDKMGKKSGDLRNSHFYANGLGGLICAYYRGSSQRALIEAGLIDETDTKRKEEVKPVKRIDPNAIPWELGAVPGGYWQNKENRIRAVKWLLEKTGKSPAEVGRKDFIHHNLAGLLQRYKSSIYFIMGEAGVLNGLKPWQMRKGVFKGYWKSRDNRVEAIKWLLKKTGKGPKELISRDFAKNELGGLLAHEYNNSTYLALKDAGVLPEGFRPWQMEQAPLGYWQDKNNRIEAVKWLIQETGKKPADIIGKDFEDNELYGLIRHYSGSTYTALREAEVLPEDFMPWQMRGGVPRGYWEIMENRTSAMKWLIEKIKKKPGEIGGPDFKDNGLWGLLTYQDGSSYRALKEAGFVVNEFEMKNIPRKGITNESFNQRVAEAMKKYVDKSKGIDHEANPN